jgi:hypothetical protein
MSDQTENRWSRRLLPLREALHRLEPSAALDARMDQALSAWPASRATSPGRGSPAWRRSPAWPAVFATAASVLFVGLGLHHLAHERTEPAAIAGNDYRASSAQSPAVSEANSGSNIKAAQESGHSPQWSANSAVFRVRATLGTYAAGRAEHGGLATGQHFWVDVGIASDGSLQIVRVAPTGTAETFVP